MRRCLRTADPNHRCMAARHPLLQDGICHLHRHHFVCAPSLASNSSRSAWKRPKTISFSHVQALAVYGVVTRRHPRTSRSELPSSDIGMRRERRRSIRASLRSVGLSSVLVSSSWLLLEGAVSEVVDDSSDATCGATLAPFCWMEAIAWPKMTMGATASVAWSSYNRPTGVRSVCARTWCG